MSASAPTIATSMVLSLLFAAAAAGAEPAGDVAAMIKDLSSSKYEVREAARRGLLVAGKSAIPALEKAAEGGGETALSARSIIDALKKGSQLLITVPRKLEAGRTDLMITTPLESLRVVAGADGASVDVIPPGGQHHEYRSEGVEKFQVEHPEAWRRYLQPALTTEGLNGLIAEAMLRVLKKQLEDKFRKALGREPTAEELRPYEERLRGQIEARLGLKKKGPAGPGQPEPPVVKPNPGRGPQLTPLE